MFKATIMVDKRGLSSDPTFPTFSYFFDPAPTFPTFILKFLLFPTFPPFLILQLQQILRDYHSSIVSSHCRSLRVKVPFGIQLRQAPFILHLVMHVHQFGSVVNLW